MATISVEKLLRIVEDSQNSFEIPADFGPEKPSGETIRYLDAGKFADHLRAIIESQPPSVDTTVQVVGQIREELDRLRKAFIHRRPERDSLCIV